MDLISVSYLSSHPLESRHLIQYFLCSFDFLSAGAKFFKEANTVIKASEVGRHPNTTRALKPGCSTAVR